MSENNLLEVLKEYAETFNGAEIYWKSDWECWRFDVSGKMFAFFSDKYLTFKNTPEQNEILRETYSFVIPGYYMNKTHWNTIVLSESKFSNDEIKALVLQSYQKIVEKLPKKTQLKLLEEK